MPYAPSSSFRFLPRLCATVGALAIALLSGCSTTATVPSGYEDDPPAPHQLSADQPGFLRLPNLPAGQTPLRVGVILPFSDMSPATRTLAAGMMKAAQLALFDAGQKNIVLMSADESAGSAKAAEKLLDQGAEVMIGPLFATSVKAVAPLTRDRGVPLISFSTDRSVAGKGVYLLSYQPQTEVERVVTYAAAKGKRRFAALIPETPYGAVVEQSFRTTVAAKGGHVVALEHYSPSAGAVSEPSAVVAKSGADAIFIPQGGSLLRAMIPVLAYNGIDKTKVRYLGTGVWDDRSNTKENLLTGGWFAAPQPNADDAFVARYRKAYGHSAPTLAPLAYDAVSLVVLLSHGKPYHRFTKHSLTDPNGFAGTGGIFRFRPDGSIERGLAVLAVGPNGFSVVNPAPTTFERDDNAKAGS
ncbi:MAG: penicillin-binding protein activator [Rhizomicrobium sp.]